MKYMNLDETNSTYRDINYGTYKQLMKKYEGTGRIWKKSYNEATKLAYCRIAHEIMAEADKFENYYVGAGTTEIAKELKERSEDQRKMLVEGERIIAELKAELKKETEARKVAEEKFENLLLYIQDFANVKIDRAKFAKYVEAGCMIIEDE